MINLNSKIHPISVFLIFFIIMTAVTYPLIFEITTHIPGFFSTDEPLGILWQSWHIKHSVFNHNSLGDRTMFLSYPFGLTVFSPGFTTYLWFGILYCLSVFTTPVLTYNLQVVANFIFTGFFSYLLVLHITKNKLSAVFSGIIFAFSPYQFMRTWQHFGLTYNGWIPLSLLAAILLKDKPDKTSKIIFLISVVLLFSFDYTITYIGVITLMVFFAYTFFFNWKNKFFKQKSIIVDDLKYFKRVIIVGLAGIIIILPQIFPIIKNLFKSSTSTLASDFNAYHRPFEHLFDMSAKPLSYFLPAAMHPLLGKFTEQFIGSSLYGLSFTEHTLYLGWTPLILAFVAFRKWKRKRQQGQFPTGTVLGNKDSFYIGFFALLALVAWFFSQSPSWRLGPLKLYMPSFFMYKILPMFRAYCRFGVAVCFAVAVLAGFGVSFILGRLKSDRTKAFIFCLFSGLVLFEFWSWPPYKVIDVSRVPAAYYWLKEEPADTVIAEYPLDTGSPGEKYKFYQTVHEKRFINFTIPGTYAHELSKTLVKLSSLRTAGVLKWMGVRYVLVHREDYLKSELIEDKQELSAIGSNNNLKFIRSFPPQDCLDSNIRCMQKTGPIDVYEVRGQAKEPEIKYDK